MSKSSRIPSYRHHKGTGQAVVVLRGRSIYLGRWNSPSSHAAYARVVAEWLAGQRLTSPSAPPSAGSFPEDLRVNELILAFFEHAQKHYRHQDGSPTGELNNYRDALRHLRQSYGASLARDFGPLRLRAVREAMLKENLCRTTINARIHRIRRAFRWAASMEMIPAAVVEGLNTVASLQRGRCEARESPGVHPVAWEVVEVTLPYLPRAVAAMVEVMRFSNCRAGDVVKMRPCDLLTDGKVWEYRPEDHKNRWREESCGSHRRIIHLGPRCQRVLLPFLDRSADAYLFSPRETLACHRAARAAGRRTKPTPSEDRRRRKKKPGRAPRDRYTTNSLQQTVRKVCRRIGIPVWTVLQVRHTRATEVRARYGLEGAAASLGDRVEAAQIYAEKNWGLARQIAGEIG